MPPLYYLWPNDYVIYKKFPYGYVARIRSSDLCIGQIFIQGRTKSSRKYTAICSSNKLPNYPFSAEGFRTIHDATKFLLQSHGLLTRE